MIIDPLTTIPRTAGIFMLLYGEAGVGKTSLALTTPNPILLDFDNGFRRAAIFKTTLVIENGWQEVLDAQSEIMKYDTIIIDTAKACLDDVISQYVIKEDNKNAKRSGALSLAGYGAMGEAFKAWQSSLRQANKNIIVVAHAKDQNDNDTIIKIPDVTGGTYSLLLRLADQVGYVHTKNNKRVVDFTPADRHIGKDTASLGTVAIPDSSHPDFDGFGVKIISGVQDKMNARMNESVKNQKLMSEFEETLNGCKSSAQFTKALEYIETDIPLNLKIFAKQLLKKISGAKDFVYDKEAKKFISIGKETETE